MFDNKPEVKLSSSEKKYGWRKDVLHNKVLYIIAEFNELSKISD